MNKVLLLAEDSPDDAVAFKRVLHQAGVANPIVEVRSGTETIYYLKGIGPYADRNIYPYPAVLFLDLVMANGDGWDVLRWFHRHPEKKTMLIVVLTGAAQRDMLTQAYLAGANSFLLKPFTKPEMDSLIEAWPQVWAFRAENIRSGAPPNAGSGLTGGTQLPA